MEGQILAERCPLNPDTMLTEVSSFVGQNHLHVGTSSGPFESQSSQDLMKMFTGLGASLLDF
jgi:hypothetical protein